MKRKIFKGRYLKEEIMMKWIKKPKFLKSKKEQTSECEIEAKVDKTFDFQSLTPTTYADKKGIYFKALNEALDNNTVFNIALTGGFGTGKSSIIETFLSRTNQYKKQNVIRVSLANFNFKKSEDKEKKRSPLIVGRNTGENEEQTALEISVIQQIIFQIKNKKVNGRFRKRISQSYLSPFFYSLLIVITGVSLVLFWNPLILYNWIAVENLYNTLSSFWFKLITFLLSFGGVITLITLLVHRFLELRLSKFELKSVGVNFDKKEASFILNSQLDELIYLLKHGEISLVIFEDLDRFKDYEIFEKLREINHVLRYSPDLENRKVKFLFVLRESIFKSETEKNKFFDLIIPTVPFISTKNAQSKMLEIFDNEINLLSDENDLNNFKSVLKIAAICIDEMRTINNIYNDYLIYLKVVESNDDKTIDVPKNELLAIIIYKNIFSLDFESINSGTSKLELVLKKRNKFLHELIESKEADIKTLKCKLKNSEEEKNSTIEELRMEYINCLLNSSQVNQGISVQGVPNISSLQLKALSSDKYFERIKKHGIRVGNPTYSFDQLEERIDNKLTYEERVEIIKQNTLEHRLKIESKIRFIEKEIKNLKTQSFASIIKKSKKEDELKNTLEKLLAAELKPILEEKEDNKKNGYSKFDFKIDLVTSLIIDGHINLNYRHYTSIFHDGDLSFNDRALYMKFKTGTVFDFEQHFDSPRAFLEQFNPSDWNKLTFFCEELFDEILYSQKYDEQLDILFEYGSEYHLKFLNFYIPTLPYKVFEKKLSDYIFRNWERFSEQALSSKLFVDSNYDVVLPQLLLNQDINVVLRQNRDNILTDYISDKEMISSFFPKEKAQIANCKNNLSDIFKALNIHFTQLKEKEKNWVLEIIYQNNLFKINIDMLNMWGKVYSQEELKYPSYSNVMKSSLKELKDYVDTNLVDFLDGVLLKLEDKFGKWEEEEEWLIELLNKDATIENANIDKSSVINQVEFYEFNLSDYDEYLWESIVSNKKLKCTWENLVLYKEKIGIDYFMLEIINSVDYIKNIDVYNEEKYKSLEYERLLELWGSLLEQKLTKDSLIELMKKFSCHISESIISAITDPANLSVLIAQKAFDPESPLEVYEQIKTHFRDDLIHLEFALKYAEEILEQEDTSKVFTSFNKEELLYIARNDFPKDFFVNAFIRIESIENMAFDNQEALDIIEKVKRFNFTENIGLFHQLFECLKIIEQTEFFNWLYDQEVLNKENLGVFLNSFKDPLDGVYQKYRKFKILESDASRRFAENLIELGLIKRYKIDNSGFISFFRNSSTC